MKALLLLSGITFLFTVAAMAADGPCESFGKYAAMRAFRADPTAKETDQTDFEATLVRTRENKSLYVVDVTEGEDKELARYFVTTEAVNPSCRVLDVTKTRSDF